MFADAFTEAGGTWIDNAVAGGVNARTAGINRIVGGDPPTAMQFNTGLQFDEIVGNGLLRDLEDVAQAGNWRDVLPEAIVQATNREGKFYAVPVNIHGQNWLWYNTKVLADAGVEPPTNYSEMLEIGPKLEAAGVVPLAFAGEPNWEAFVFNSVLVTEGGRDLYLEVLGNKNIDAVRSDDFRRVAETFAQLRELVDEGSPGRKWNDATNMVITGKAAMQVMGDWAKGEFIAAGQTAGRGVWLRDPRRRRRGRLHHGRRRLRLPRGRRPGAGGGAGQAGRADDGAADADRVQQEKGLGPGPPRRRRLEHGRVRATGHGRAAG